jgi:hypothetical protein
MTFQIGIVGTDGVLLASDMLVNQRGISGHTYGDTYSTSKIADSKGIAYCCTGDYLTILAAEKVTIEIENRDTDTKQFLQYCGAHVLQQETIRSANMNDWDKLTGGSVLFAYKLLYMIKK